LRVVLISEVAPAVEGLAAILRAEGHDLVALLCVRDDPERYTGLDELVRGGAARSRRRDARVTGPDRTAAPSLRVSVEDPARGARGSTARHRQRASVAPSPFSRPEPRLVGDSTRRERDRLHVSRSADEVARQVRAWRFHSAVPGDRGALIELEGETVRVLRVSRDEAEGRALRCADGTLWIVEKEAV